MMEYYLIDEQKIEAYLDGLEKQDPERTLSSLDLLLTNLQNNLFDVIAKSSKIMFEIDHADKSVSLLGDIFPSDNWQVMFDSEVTSTSIYNSFVNAISCVDIIPGGDDLIKKIKPKKIS